jgi:hypothetical protein
MTATESYTDGRTESHPDRPRTVTFADGTEPFAAALQYGNGMVRSPRVRQYVGNYAQYLNRVLLGIPGNEPPTSGIGREKATAVQVKLREIFRIAQS